MNFTDFANSVKKLVQFESQAFKLDEILGADVSAGGILGDIGDAYGELIIQSVTNGKTIPDAVYEDFWNLIFVFVDDNYVDEKEIKIFYEEITANE